MFSRVPVYYPSLHSNETTVQVWRGAAFPHFYRTEDGYFKEEVHLRQNLELQIPSFTEMIFESC